MSTKKALREKVQKLRTRNKLLRSDNVIELDNLKYRATFAEAKAERLTKENDALKERLAAYEKGSHVGHTGESTRTLEVPNGATISRASEHAGNPPAPPEISHR